MVGGITSVLQGGKFGHGFVSSMMTASMKGFIKPQTGAFADAVRRTVIAGAVGGTVSELTGGKFANGAVTSAMQWWYNAEDQGKFAKSGRAYDPTDPTYHEYTIKTRVCDLGENGCSVSMVGDVANAESVPFHYKPESGNIDIGGNPIIHMEGDNWSLNITRPGHDFHDGQVLHTVTVQEGGVYLTTYGTGVVVDPVFVGGVQLNIKPAMNNIAGYALFGKMHADVYVTVKYRQIHNFYGSGD